MLSADVSRGNTANARQASGADGPTSRSPALSAKAVAATAAPAADSDANFLPNFCEPKMVLGVVLVAELVAFLFALARPADAGFLNELARISVFIQWTGLTSAGLLCLLARHVRSLSAARLTVAVFALLTLNVTVLSVLAVAGGHWLEQRGLGAGLFPATLGPFLLRNVVIALLVGALLLRYLYVSHQWRAHLRAEASARIEALQARIRPHFLFNSLNTIAALTRSDAPRAEEAIEDLSDLFRATLREAEAMIPLKEELELARIYQRIEALRLGDRLDVQWNVDALPMRMQVPSLTIQPLLENAINHGVAGIADGGTITIDGSTDGTSVRFVMANPAPPEGTGPSLNGSGIAIGNIRDRLRLAYGDQASIVTIRDGERFCVELVLPMSTAGADR